MPFGNLRNQDITYWTQSGLDDYGYPSFNAPSTVKGRWEDRVVLVDQEQGGQMVTSNSRVWLQEELSNGDYVYEGTSVAATPPEEARKVIRKVEVPSIDGKRVERQYYLD